MARWLGAGATGGGVALILLAQARAGLEGVGCIRRPLGAESNLHHEPRIKPSAALLGVASLVSQNPSRADMVIDVVVRMAVNPEPNPARRN